MLSMTAFARNDHSGTTGTFTWEIRSVNARYLEMHFRLPESLKGVEAPVREILRKQLSRGKLECSLKFVPTAKNQNLAVNASLVAQLNDAADQVHAVIGPGNALDALEILKWPGVLEHSGFDQKEVEAEALAGFQQALDSLVNMRKREGGELKRFIAQRLEGIEQEVEKVKAALPEILQTQRQNLLDKLADIKQQVEPERFEQEMVILLNKADVDEELDRLGAHLKEVNRILKQQGAVGRRLDFMMQELNREANTLSSKSISHITTQIAVELKVLIEQMREQVQNIE